MSAVQGALDHLFMPLLASTLTTILAFMPILLIEGNAGDFIGTISVSVILALIFSFLLSMTIIPSICAWLENKFGDREDTHWWQVGIRSEQHTSAYRAFLASSLAHPWRAVVVSIALCISGLVLVGSLPKVFSLRLTEICSSCAFGLNATPVCLLLMHWCRKSIKSYERRKVLSKPFGLSETVFRPFTTTN